MTKSVITPIRTATLPCLPGCAEDHAEQLRKGRTIQECSVVEPIGTAHGVVSNAATTVEAFAATEAAERYPAVLLTRTDLPLDYQTEMTTSQAREFAALILAAADRADQIVSTSLDAA